MLPWHLVTSGQGPVAGREIPRPRRILTQLGVAAAAVLGVVLVGTSLAANRLAEREAVTDAAHLTNFIAVSVVQPALRNSLLDGDEAAYAALDAVVRESVLPNDIVRVKLWRPDGTIVYADDRRLVGQVFPLGPDQISALSDPRTNAEVSELTRSENELERPNGKLLEVYRPVWTPSGRELLFEVYGDYEPVRRRADDLWRGMAGLLASGLMLMLVLMIPILLRVLGRLRAAHEQRESLLRRAVDASDDERRRIAATLHDGPVQELVASSLAVSGAARQAQAQGATGLATEIGEAASTVRGAVATLRALLVDIYPQRLGDAGLAAAIADLTGPLVSRGVAVDTRVDPAVAAATAEAHQWLVYAVARECLRNVATHAAATHVSVAFDRDMASPARPAMLLVEDDGVGFDAAGELPQRRGHFGLRLLADLARDAGARLEVASGPGQGTRWRLTLPAESGTDS
ncbi:MAG: histidine kinase [Dermatophilaceae bacterium]